MLLPQLPRGWHITDHEWRSIADPVNLPEKARNSLEFTIYLFRFSFLEEYYTRRTPPKKRRAKLERTAQAGRDFIATVSWLGVPEHESLRDALPFDECKEETGAEKNVVADQLSAACGQVQRIVDWCAEAERYVRRCDKKGLLRDFVLRLDRILFEHTGQQIKRSSKPQQPIVQFVRAACKVFDSRVGNGSIDEAMKAAILKRGKIRE
jgi:hypothetical protein